MVIQNNFNIANRLTYSGFMGPKAYLEVLPLQDTSRYVKIVHLNLIQRFFRRVFGCYSNTHLSNVRPAVALLSSACHKLSMEEKSLILKVKQAAGLQVQQDEMNQYTPFNLLYHSNKQNHKILAKQTIGTVKQKIHGIDDRHDDWNIELYQTQDQPHKAGGCLLEKIDISKPYKLELYIHNPRTHFGGSLEISHIGKKCCLTIERTNELSLIVDVAEKIAGIFGKTHCELKSKLFSDHDKALLTSRGWKHMRGTKTSVYQLQDKSKSKQSGNIISLTIPEVDVHAMILGKKPV